MEDQMPELIEVLKSTVLEMKRLGYPIDQIQDFVDSVYKEDSTPRDFDPFAEVDIEANYYSYEETDEPEWLTATSGKVLQFPGTEAPTIEADNTVWDDLIEADKALKSDQETAPDNGQ